jgi:hypothetical protein
VAKGDPIPSVQMNALDGTANPLIVSWTPTTDQPDPSFVNGIQSYTVTYQIGEALPATLTTLTRDANGNLSTSIGVYVGDNTQYRFNVEATTYTGKISGPVGQSGWASTHTSLPPYSASDSDDEGANQFDPAADLPCLPPTDPEDLIHLLFLASDVCGAQTSVVWQRQPPLTGAVCPGSQLPFLAAQPTMCRRS